MSKIILENPVGKNNEDLRLYAKRIGVEFTEDVIHADLVKAVGKRNKELEKSGEGEKANASETPSSENKGKFFYWIKMKTYIDSDPQKSDKLVPAGLYVVDKPLTRLKDQPENLVEMFEGEIPERKIEEIAISRGMKISASDKIDFDELLEKLINQIS